MEPTIKLNRDHFFVIGINYQKADAMTRGRYTFFPEQVDAIVSQAKKKQINHFFIVSTCNRTEIYGFAEDEKQLINLFCTFTKGDSNDFLKYAIIKKSDEAIDHLFRVSSGLESQILGDFDIVGQIKIWFNRFKNAGASNYFLERLVNTVVHSSRKVKNETLLNNGSASVAFSAVNFIQNLKKKHSNQNILMYGMGKIGQNTLTNLVKYYPDSEITVINRTKEKALLLGQKFNVTVKDHSSLKEVLSETDILIVATGAECHTITKSMIDPDKKMIMIDLSVPENIDRSLADNINIKLINVDGLSQMVDQTLEVRKNAVPDALRIIDELKNEFYQWLKTRDYVPIIHSFKNRLDFFKKHIARDLEKDDIELSEKELLLTEKVTQKITNQFASYLLDNQDEADDTIRLVQKMFQLKNG